MNIIFRAKLERNRCVRFFAFPYVRIRNQIRVWRFMRSEDSKYIAGLKNIYKDGVCFVIGNGPSLSVDDLNKLDANKVVCFGVNRIFHIFQTTNWRPTYYLCLDSYVATTEIESIKYIGDFPKFINSICSKFGRNPEDQIHYLCVHRKFPVNPAVMTAKTLSSDPSIFSQKTSTVVANAIELAVYMGFTTIYLLGVDNNYALKRINGKVYTDPSVKSSYFSGMKVNNNTPQSIQDVEYMNSTFAICKKFAEEHGVKIYNATRGGKLEEFERVDFDELMMK